MYFRTCHGPPYSSSAKRPIGGGRVTITVDKKSERMSPHDTLGVPPDADLETIKAAYRKLAMQFHPDRNPGDAAAAARMKDINLAYEEIKGGVLGFIVMLVIAIAGS